MNKKIQNVNISLTCVDIFSYVIQIPELKYVLYQMRHLRIFEKEKNIIITAFFSINLQWHKAKIALICRFPKEIVVLFFYLFQVLC